jgi:hypothetical protein
VTIKGYKFFHARLLSSGEDFHQSNLMVGVALSYFHFGLDPESSLFNPAKGGTGV